MRFLSIDSDNPSILVSYAKSILPALKSKYFAADQVIHDLLIALAGLPSLLARIKEYERYENEKLKASYDHANSASVKKVLENIAPELRATWEAGRAEGFRAHYDKENIKKT
jgi:hypothetical protein